jgi:hypothetical protein
MLLSYLLVGTATALGAAADAGPATGSHAELAESAAPAGPRPEAPLSRNRGPVMFRLSVGIGLAAKFLDTTVIDHAGEKLRDLGNSSDSAVVANAKLMLGLRLTPAIALGGFIDFGVTPSKNSLADDAVGFVGPEAIVHPLENSRVYFTGRVGWLIHGVDGFDTIEYSAWIWGVGVGVEHAVPAGPTLGGRLDMTVTNADETWWGDMNDYETTSTTVTPSLNFTVGFN